MHSTHFKVTENDWTHENYIELENKWLDMIETYWTWLKIIIGSKDLERTLTNLALLAKIELKCIMSWLVIDKYIGLPKTTKNIKLDSNKIILILKRLDMRMKFDLK